MLFGLTQCHGGRATAPPCDLHRAEARMEAQPKAQANPPRGCGDRGREGCAGSSAASPTTHPPTPGTEEPRRGTEEGSPCCGFTISFKTPPAIDRKSTRWADGPLVAHYANLSELVTVLAVSVSAMTGGAGGRWPPRRTTLLAGLASALVVGWMAVATARAPCATPETAGGPTRVSAAAGRRDGGTGRQPREGRGCDELRKAGRGNETRKGKGHCG